MCHISSLNKFQYESDHGGLAAQKATEHFLQNPVMFVPTLKAGTVGSSVGNVKPWLAPGFKATAQHSTPEQGKSPTSLAGEELFP